MAVRIEEISVEQAGPVANETLKLKQFNLIYGRNERGKTFLVEFVLNSLFQNLEGWSVRDSNSQGKVLVSGLDAEKYTGFMPSTKPKLEKILSTDKPGMPAQINRLLVVKGADLSFEKGKGRDVSRAVLKEFLSGQGILDDIQAEISATVRGASIEDGQISGSNMGEIKTRKQLSDRRQDVDKLFDQVDAIYSGGDRQVLLSRIDELKVRISEQELAKRHHAYSLSQKIHAQQRQLDRIPSEDLDALKANLAQLRGTEAEIVRQEARLEELERESEYYTWLKEAVAVYEQREITADPKISPAYLIVITLALLLAIAFSFAGIPAATVLLVVIAAVAAWLYLGQYRSSVQMAADIEEINELKAAFKNRFQTELSGLPELKELIQAKEQPYFGSKTLREELEEERRKRDVLEGQLSTKIREMNDSTPQHDPWELEIGRLIARREELETEQRQLDIKLASLNIGEADYSLEKATVSYDREKLEIYQTQLAQVENDLKDETQERYSLKQRIAEKTGDDIAIDWEQLLQNLQKKRAEISAEYREITAKILAGILVDSQLDVIRDEEEQTIKENLESNLVAGPIHSVTGRYTGIRYEDGVIYLDYDKGSYPLSTLSTGALEQVLLALRLGFAAKIFKGKKLFLILDDAFQHADWERRQLLVDKAVKLAQEGWQIIYFTMDDHIRDLFNAAGKKHFPENYAYHVLKLPADEAVEVR